MKRHCTDPLIDPYTSAAVSSAVMFSDDHQFLQPDLPYHSSPLLPLPNTHIPEPIQIQLDTEATTTNNNHDGASIETPRRPRGRPPGSKNKPKSLNQNPTRLTQPDLFNPVFQPNHNHNDKDNHRHQILEIPNGADIIDSIAKHALLHNTSLRVVHVSGSVFDVTVRQPNPHHQSPIVNLGGRHDVVSLSAFFINPPIEAFTDVAITMSFQKGVVGGGFVVGPLTACGSVYVLVESISNLTYHRLDFVERRDDIGNTTSSGVGQSPPVDELLNVPMYSSSDFIMPY